MNIKKKQFVTLCLVLPVIGLMLVTVACTSAPTAVPAQATPAPAQEGAIIDPDSPVTVESARGLPAVVDEADPWFAALSPDGAHLVYYKEEGRARDRTKQLCIYTFNSAAKMCYDLSPDLFVGYPYQFQWSPDSSMIAFSENPVELGNESDIWLFNLVDGSFTNLTDDGLTGAWRATEGETFPNVDYLPAWNPADGQIYFWRFVSLGEYLKFNLGIYRLAPEGGEVELVRDLTEAMPQSVPIFQQEAFYMDGPSAISPDGQSIAALIPTIDEFGGAQTGLWLIDLTDAEAAPRELMPPSEFAAAVPAWQSFPTFPNGLSWTADAQSVLVIAHSDDTHTPFTVFYNVNVADGSVIPVVDFSSLSDPESYFEPAPDSELIFRYYSPRTASMSPQGDKLLMLNDLGNVMGMFTAPLPPDGSLPIVSAAAEESTMSTALRSSRSQDGKVLMYGLLFMVQE